MMHRTTLGFAAILGAAAIALPLASPSAPNPGFVATVESTHPIAYYRLTGSSGSSEVGTTSYTAAGALTPSSSCAPLSIAGNQCTVLDGKTGYFDTTQMGGIRGAGSMLAWVNVSVLPSVAGRIVYVAGISQNGNDFDMQFEPDNMIHFYTASGSNVSFAPLAASLAGRWHMIAATFNAVTARRAIYWDGQLAKIDHGGGTPGKNNEFSIGESKVFTGRFFPVSITDVALWNSELAAPDVWAIYVSRRNAP